MNRSFSKIRHIQEVNKKLEERRISLLNEQVDISKYQGSQTDVEDLDDMGNIKVTREEGEIKKQPMNESNPIYKEIVDFFFKNYKVKVTKIEEAVDKTKNPDIYEAYFPSLDSNYSAKSFEFDINDIRDPKQMELFDKRFNSILPSIPKITSTERTFRT